MARGLQLWAPACRESAVTVCNRLQASDLSQRLGIAAFLVVCSRVVLEHRSEYRLLVRNSLVAWHATTILSVRRGDRVALGGDGHVTLGTTVMKADAVKVLKLLDG